MTRLSVKLFLKNIKRSNMKPGDKVWVFLPREEEIRELSFTGKVTVEGLNAIDPVSGFPWTIPEKYCFPTREALCEHYRKIFG